MVNLVFFQNENLYLLKTLFHNEICTKIYDIRILDPLQNPSSEKDLVLDTATSGYETNMSRLFKESTLHNIFSVKCDSCHLPVFTKQEARGNKFLVLIHLHIKDLYK